MSDLVERAAKHVAALNGHSEDWERYIDEAADYVNFVRADALEEAAKVAEDFDDKICGDEILPPSQFDIADAIRALKDAPDDSDDGQPDQMQEWRDFDPDC